MTWQAKSPQDTLSLRKVVRTIESSANPPPLRARGARRRGYPAPVRRHIIDPHRTPRLMPRVLHCVVSTDTLVDPRVTLPSLKRTKMRLLPGSKGTVPPPVTKTA